MFYGRRKVEELVSQMILLPPEREAVLELVHALLFPELPPTLAEIILANPQIALGDNPFSANLAFGLVDTGLELREESKRHEKYRLVFRQVNAVGYELEQRDFSSPLVTLTEERFWLLAIGAEAAKDLSSQEPLPASIRAAFAEQLLIALSGHHALMVLLLQHASAGWSEGKKCSTIRTIAGTTEEALRNDPLEETQLVYEPAGPPRFHRSNLENDQFRRTAEGIADSLVSGFRSSTRSVAATVLH